MLNSQYSMSLIAPRVSVLLDVYEDRAGRVVFGGYGTRLVLARWRLQSFPYFFFFSIPKPVFKIDFLLAQTDIVYVFLKAVHMGDANVRHRKN